MISLLPQSVINQIAAGEVVERPASVVKELIENSIDAGATEIKVFIKEYGLEKIQIIDNGAGIAKSDFDKVFLKHSTSKINNIDDLNTLNSFGFRGEALASISSVSRIIFKTKNKEDDNGSEALVIDGKLIEIKPSSITQGTDIQILNLFENIPARKKFLKTKATENKIILDVFNKFVLANPNISFTIDFEGSIKTFSREESLSRVSKLLKVEEKKLIPVFYDGVIKIKGYAVHPSNFFKSKINQFMFVNGRMITDSTIYKGIIDGYDTFLMKNQYAGFAIFLDIPSNLVDVNVHPRKTEVRFINPSEVYKSVKTAVNVGLVKALREETHKKLAFTTQEESTDKADEFENFLKSSITSPSNTPSNNYSSIIDQEEVLDIKPAITTSQAILFNEEVIKEEPTKYAFELDLINATQLQNSYIITSNGNSILIIDQHAASERYFYEHYLKQLKKKTVTSKLLLFPEIIELDDFQQSALQSNKAIFEELGFEYELFGSNEIKFTKVPDFVKMNDFPKLIIRIISDIIEHDNISNIKEEIFHEIAAILACHTAVRFGDKLNREEIISILKNLLTCEDPYNCPHGRPIIQEFGSYDIEKRFKRCGL